MIGRNVIVAAVALLCATSSLAAPANLIVNGSFELGTNGASAGSWTMEGVGSTNIAGWWVTQNNVDWGNGFWQAADGTHSLDLNGNLGAGGVHQPIVTVIGQTYRLSFALAGNPNLSNEVAIDGDMLVSLIAFAGGTSANFDFNVLTTYDNLNMHWLTQTLDFTATDTTTVIGFLSTTVLPWLDIGAPNCCYGPALDRVSVISTVPETATLPLFAAGLLIVFGRRKRTDLITLS